MVLLGTMNLTEGGLVNVGTVILPGKYTLTVTKVESKLTKKGNPQIMVVFETQEKETISEYYNLDDSKEYTRDLMYTLLHALGNDMEKFDGNIRSEMFIGRKIDAIVKRRYSDYQGKWFSRIVEMGRHKNVILYNRNEAEITAMQTEKSNSNKSTQFSFSDDTKTTDLPFSF